MTPDEVRFLAILVQKGHLPKAAAEGVFRAASAGRPLEETLVGLGLFTAERLQFLKRTGGESAPGVPGHTYVGCAGTGGTSVVFRATENATGRDVALKVMHRDLCKDPIQKGRFVREAKLLMQLDHANIVRGYRVGHVKEADGTERLVFIMEWVPGDSLLSLLKKGMRFDEDAALYIILQAARALDAMHQKGILHRDVKPDNVLLTPDNTVKLIDLGFATTLDHQADEAKQAGSDTTLGTAAYMSPEQARGLSDLDVRSDIYSLGATLFQIIVGELPFQGEGTQEQLAARILEALSSPELQSRRISPHMNYFIRKMMEQDRDFRYSSMKELMADIEEQIRGKKTLTYRAGPERDDEGGGDALQERPIEDGDSGGSGGPPRFPIRRRRR